MKTLRRRGQAATELALGSLVLVTLLIFSIYFGEVTFGALKVHEAANSAMFDLTSYKAHSMTSILYDYRGPIDNAVAATQANTNAEYQDFDGRTLWGEKNPNIVQVFTQTQGMQVNCARGDSADYSPNPLVAGMYGSGGDGSGARCWASADFFTTPKMPANVAEGAGGFFQKQHWQRNVLRQCSTGRARGGNCTGQFAIMLDDWGLTGPVGMEWMPAFGVSGNGFATPNTSYWWTIFKGYSTAYPIVGAFNPTMFWLPASVMAMTVNFGVHPMGIQFGIPFMMGNESKFYMSFDSSVTGFQHFLLPFLGGMPEAGGLFWETTPLLFSLLPSYAMAFGQRMGNGGCYLGKSCN